MPADRGGLVMRAVKYMSAGVIYPMEVESYITKRYIYRKRLENRSEICVFLYLFCYCYSFL